MNHLEFITLTLSEASEIALNHFGKVSGTTKTGDNNQVLTQADLEIGQHIIRQLEEHFPDHNVIDEEAGVIDRGSSFTWVVDPIDGTSNFANGIPTYGIMVGLLENNQPIAGGVALPYFQEIYWAEKGGGAFCNDQPIHATSSTELLKTLVAYGIDGHQENPSLTNEEAQILGKVVLGIRNLRSSNSVFDLMMVARGNYGGCLNRTSKIWDNVAQQVILEEAGAVYTTFDGQPLDYTQPLTKVDQNYTFCTAPASLHQQLQAIMNA